VLFEGRLMHQAAQHKMGNEQRVDCLDDSNGLFAAQRVMDESLMDVELIDREFNLPAFVGGGYQVERGNNARVEPPGD